MAYKREDKNSQLFYDLGGVEVDLYHSYSSVIMYLHVVYLWSTCCFIYSFCIDINVWTLLLYILSLMSAMIRSVHSVDKILLLLLDVEYIFWSVLLNNQYSLCLCLKQLSHIYDKVLILLLVTVCQKDHYARRGITTTFKASWW